MLKTGLAIAAVFAAGLGAVACSGPPNAQQIEQNQQQAQLRVLQQAQPLPHFNYSQERQALITAEQIAANGTQTTSFFFNQGARDPIFSCPSIGLGVPDSAQLSNPQQIAPVSGNYGGGTQVIAQEDPYGVYTPISSTGTYVICVDSQGREYLDRWEGFVQTVTAPATWNYGTHTMQLVGAPTVAIHTKK